MKHYATLNMNKLESIRISTCMAKCFTKQTIPVLFFVVIVKRGNNTFAFVSLEACMGINVEKLLFVS